tara:strand:- start:999 stop:1838 length:840 start_codon:yes stop_codon:yes gene_type:complete
MSEIRVNTIKSENGGGNVSFPKGISVTGVTTSTSFVGDLTGDVTGDLTGTATNASGLTGSPSITVTNITGVAATFSGVLTYDDVTNVDSVGIVTARSGLRVVGGGATITGVTTFFNDLRAKGVIENVSAATTFLDSTNKVVLELDLLASTTYSYSMQPANIGVVSFKNMPADAQGGTTVTVLFTQASATTGGVGNTTFGVGLGTACTVIPNVGGAAQAGISTRAFVGGGTTFVGLSTTPGDKEFVSFFVHYNGGTNTNANSYDIFVTKNGQFRPSVVGV